MAGQAGVNRGTATRGGMQPVWQCTLLKPCVCWAKQTARTAGGCRNGLCEVALLLWHAAWQAGNAVARLRPSRLKVHAHACAHSTTTRSLRERQAGRRSHSPVMMRLTWSLMCEKSRSMSVTVRSTSK